MSEKGNADRWRAWMEAELQAGSFEYGNGRNATLDIAAHLYECGEANAELLRLAAALRDTEREREEAREAIRALYEWAYAQEWEHEEEQIVAEVAPEMALDAGDRSMAGAPIYGKVKVTFVLAESGEPWRDLMDSNPAVQAALAGDKEKA